MARNLADHGAGWRRQRGQIARTYSSLPIRRKAAAAATAKAGQMGRPTLYIDTPGKWNTLTHVAPPFEYDYTDDAPPQQTRWSGPKCSSPRHVRQPYLRKRRLWYRFRSAWDFIVLRPPNVDNIYDDNSNSDAVDYL